MTRSEPRTSRPGRAAPRATSSGIVSTRRCSSARSDTRSRRRGARRDSAAPVATQAPASAQPPPRRILIVDDNVEAALTLAELLALEGHETHVAHDGPSAVEGLLLVALSGWVQPDDRARSREAGFDHHLAKPVQLKSLELVLLEAWVDRGRNA